MQTAVRAQQPRLHAARSGALSRPQRLVRSVAVRSAGQEPPEMQPIPAMAEPGTSAPAPQSFALFNQFNEAINSRSAMLGFVAAMIGEASTHHSVFSQVAGRYENMELVEKPFELSSVLFFGIIALVTVGTAMPKLLDNENPDSGRSFGPFTPGLELILGRAAQMGFAGVVLIEFFKGSSLL